MRLHAFCYQGLGRDKKMIYFLKCFTVGGAWNRLRVLLINHTGTNKKWKIT